MPIYEYQCQDCGQFELIQKITEDPITECPTCKKKVQRLVSASAFHLKGTGWYKTDYPSSSPNTGAGSSSTKPAASESKSLEAPKKETKTTEKSTASE